MEMFSTLKKELGKKLTKTGRGRPEITNDSPPNQGRLIIIMGVYIPINLGGYLKWLCQ
jgi:hypothetical protein